jgi:hypothetical protein
MSALRVLKFEQYFLQLSNMKLVSENLKKNGYIIKWNDILKLHLQLEKCTKIQTLESL